MKVSDIAGPSLFFFLGWCVWKDSRALEHKAFVGRRLALGGPFENFDLCSDCAEGVPGNVAQLLLLDWEVF